MKIPSFLSGYESTVMEIKVRMDKSILHTLWFGSPLLFIFPAVKLKRILKTILKRW